MPPAFRAWLTARYSTDTALRSAWHDPTVALTTASVPSPTERRASPTGILHDPQTQQALIDFAEYQNDAMAGLVCNLAHAVRTASRGRKLSVFFYGYVFEFGPTRLGPATCGHYALRKVLDCPDVDVICSPTSYFDRGVGGSAPAMTPVESISLSGKMYLFEDDTRTYLANDTLSQAKDLADSKAILIRNVAQEATRNCATWWMDLGMTGWFNDTRFWTEMRRLAATDRPFLQRAIPFRPQVAAVIDERSIHGVSASGWNVTDPGIYKVREPLGRLCAPYGQYLLDDVTRGRVKARLYVFLNAWRLTASQRAALLRNTRGAARIWCYAPGLYDGDHASVSAMRELTGFRLAHKLTGKAWATPTDLGRRLGIRTAFGLDQPVAPLFVAVDAMPEETLAMYPDGSAAVALRKTRDGWSVFAGVPGLTAEVLRAVARKAGVHLYTDRDCNVYANGPIVALHAPRQGAYSIDVGRSGVITDALTGQPVGRGPHVRLMMNRGETRVLLTPDAKPRTTSR